MDPGKNLGKCGEHRKKRWEDLRKSEELGENPRKTDGHGRNVGLEMVFLEILSALLVLSNETRDCD